MRFLSRSRFVPVTALAVYMVVNIGAAAVHHHHAAAPLSDWRSPGSDRNPVFQTRDTWGDDDAEHCLLCTVLHLAQNLASVLRVETATAVADQVFSDAASIPSHPLGISTYSRGPPLM
jgi:hypothetical protein